MNAYSLSLPTKTLTITKGFEDAVATGKGAEYETYMRLLQDIPGLTVIRKTHKRPNKYRTKGGEEYNCNQFKNLTYENMEGFMKGLPNGEDYLTPYYFLKNCGSLVHASRYKAVREWFVAQFPDFRKNPLVYVSTPAAVVDAEPFFQEAQERTDKINEAKAAEEAKEEQE